MRFIFFAVVLSFHVPYSFSQSLNGSWFNIKATRIDGSRIVKKTDSRGAFQYIFDGTEIFEVDTPNHHLYTKAIKRHSQRKIYAVSDSVLILEDDYYPDELDKRNRYTVMRQKEYYRYLKRSNLMVYENDTIVIANNYIFPLYVVEYLHEGLTSVLFEKLKPVSGAISGYLILSSNNKIVDIQIMENRNFGSANRFKKELKKTEPNWRNPLDSLYLKVYFTIADDKNGISLDMTLKPNDFNHWKREPAYYNVREINSYIERYKRALSYLEKKQFEKAIEDLTACIQYDPHHIEAYYKRASAFIELGKSDQACMDYKTLKDLGQVRGAKLHSQLCIK